MHENRKNRKDKAICKTQLIKVTSAYCQCAPILISCEKGPHPELLN